ncbi:hypothetical protein [uncultured Algoriphagus sp.]|uniref:hypothetical protein n=1 Tax=uncultured Algoriphagus sp. TaxID=417365 RepID=UPI0030EC422E|tara:strand:+ start:3969 stop:4667 length:699 start_codon:yes stop_codon:yes gene_type:complete
MKKKFVAPSFFALVFSLSIACSPSEKTEEIVLEEEPEVVLVEDFVLVIDEHKLDKTPITNHPSAAPAAKPAAEPDNTSYEVLPAVDFQKEMLTSYDLVEVPVIQSEIAIPLDETQTVMAYNKKGKSKGAVQVVSNSDGEVDHILFEDKNHKDIYDVQAGMSAKEVKKLRKEMKHMVKNGQVFYYTDDSNIMYLLDTEVPEEGAVVEADIEESVVSAVIWKNKNHKDHPKNSK